MATSATAYTLVENWGAVGSVCLNRPEKKNALPIRGYLAVAEAIDNLAVQGCSVIVLRAVGPDFCSGGDFNELNDAIRTGRAEPVVEEFASAAQSLFITIEETPAIVVCAVQGRCLAGGLVMVLCSDLCVATEDAVFGVPEGLVGLAESFVPLRLGSRIGVARAKEMMFTGRSIEAHSALSWGLINRVTAGDRLSAETNELIGQILRTGKNARAAYKRVINRTFMPFDPGVVIETNVSAEASEGMRAFLERRAPQWLSESEGTWLK